VAIDDIEYLPFRGVTFRVSTQSHSSSAECPDLAQLVGLFHHDARTLGTFQRVDVERLPEIPRRLLAHNEHMTVTVESHHRSPVDVDVLHTWETDGVYAREILLRRQSDGAVVQFGIVRIRWEHLPPEVRREIERRERPLGRILIEHHVLRRVECAALWEIEPGDDLRQWLGLRPAERTYGRTAWIHVGGEPAVELLEVVVPDEAVARRGGSDRRGGER